MSEAHKKKRTNPLWLLFLKPSQLKAATGRILDKAIRRPQYVSRNGVLLVITKADSVWVWPTCQGLRLSNIIGSNAALAVMTLL